MAGTGLYRLSRHALIVVVTLLCHELAHGDLVYTAVGTSAKGVNVIFEAEFSIVGDDLWIGVRNVSTDPILNPDDVLGSMYFDIYNGVSRPTLENYAATGDVYLTDKNGPETLVGTGSSDLVADTAGDGTWQFKQLLDVGSSPNLGFGVGTVGNNLLNPNSFNGNITGAIQYSIYSGEITTQNLHGKNLVKDEIEIHFTGVDGFTEDDITGVVFGLGTAPDSTIIASVPEPSSFLFLLLVAGCSLGFVFLKKKA